MAVALVYLVLGLSLSATEVGLLITAGIGALTGLGGLIGLRYVWRQQAATADNIRAQTKKTVVDEERVEREIAEAEQRLRQGYIAEIETMRRMHAEDMKQAGITIAQLREEVRVIRLEYENTVILMNEQIETLRARAGLIERRTPPGPEGSQATPPAQTTPDS